MKKIIILALVVLASCQPKPDTEQLGRQMLQRAREAYMQADYESARDTIMSLREQYPTALESRRQAILLLDSVELMEAQLQQDTLKTEFFRRKLEHDIEHLKVNN